MKCAGGSLVRIAKAEPSGDTSQYFVLCGLQTHRENYNSQLILSIENEYALLRLIIQLGSYQEFVIGSEFHPMDLVGMLQRPCWT